MVYFQTKKYVLNSEKWFLQMLPYFGFQYCSALFVNRHEHFIYLITINDIKYWTLGQWNPPKLVKDMVQVTSALTISSFLILIFYNGSISHFVRVIITQLRLRSHSIFFL